MSSERSRFESGSDVVPPGVTRESFFHRIGVSSRGKSRALTRALSDFGTEHFFAQAAARIKERYGFELHRRTVRGATLEEGNAFGGGLPKRGPSRSGPWRKTQQRRLQRGAIASVIAELGAHREPPGTPPEEAPVANAYRYLNNRHDNLDYKSVLQEVLLIGSGLLESGHRHVLQARLKKSGTSWLPQTAESMAQLRALRAHDPCIPFGADRFNLTHF